MTTKDVASPFRRRLLEGFGGAVGLSLMNRSVRAEEAPEASDVLVVGCGAAGLAAAVTAREAGARRVTVLEKTAMAGGHMLVSNGMLNALDPEGQRRMGTRDSIEDFRRDTWEGGGRLAEPGLVDRLVQDSPDILAWLGDMGVIFEERLFEAYTGVHPRAHRTRQERSGFEYAKRLMIRARALGVDVRFRCRAVRLLMTGSRVTGVVAEGPDGMSRRFRSRAVILATGGFGANAEMRAEWAPQVPPELGTTYSLNRQDEDPATGDGIRMGLTAGAALTGMAHVMVIPFWGGRVLDSPGAEMFLTQEGRRFTDETASWDRVFRDLARTGSGQFWVVTDGRSTKGVTFAAKVQQGRVMSAGSVGELARRMNVDERNLREAFGQYNAAAHSGTDPAFGRTRFLQDLSTPPFYCGRERFEVHYTCGGLAIDRDARVLARTRDPGAERSVRSPVPGLLAAGETTGGVHGNFRLGGNGLLDAFVFGRAAGRTAAEMLRAPA